MKNICSVCGNEIPKDEVFEKIICPNGKEICRCHPCVASDRSTDAHAYVFSEFSQFLDSFLEDGKISEELAEDMLSYMLGGEKDCVSMGHYSKKDSASMVKSIISECKENLEKYDSIQDLLCDEEVDFEERLDEIEDDYNCRNRFFEENEWRRNLEEERNKGTELYAYTYWFHELKDKDTGLNNENIGKSIFDNLED